MKKAKSLASNSRPYLSTMQTSMPAATAECLQLFDADRSFEELREDYFSHAFGGKWRDVAAYFDKLRACFSFDYLSGRFNGEADGGRFISPEIGKRASPNQNQDAFGGTAKGLPRV